MEVTTTNERIKKLRKDLGLTQQEFADKIGMKRNTVANYETNRNEPSNSVISLICREFHVNEEWLRYGSGEPFQAAPETLADKLAQEYGLDDLGRQIMVGYLNLNESDRLAVGRLIQNIVDERAAADEEPDAHALYEAEARAKAEAYYQELMQEREATDGRSVFLNFDGGDLLA